MSFSLQSYLRVNSPDFSDLPWHLPLSDWEGICNRLAQVATGLSRHPVVFVNYDGQLYSLKELPHADAKKEYQALLAIEDRRLPTVSPIGYMELQHQQYAASILITRFLDLSLPYRTLFMSAGLERYQEHLLDAMAWLLVQLHLAGVFWGDCSLSNTLFRRDAGTLRAYLVDAETAEIHTTRLMPTLRYQDLEIMEVNVTGDLDDLALAGYLNQKFHITDTGVYIRQRYRDLWEQVTREEIIHPTESYRIQERIRALNALGFTVEEIEIPATSDFESIRLRISVTDRNFHRDHLMELTGLETEELQAQKMMNEIRELKATLSRERNQSMPLSAAAYHWFEYIYKPVSQRIQTLITQRQMNHAGGSPLTVAEPAELYCEILEHKWYLSERAMQDVGHLAAVDDYLTNIAKDLHIPEA